MKRKSYSAALAFVLVLVMAIPGMVPSMAASGGQTLQELTGAGGVDFPVLNVTVPLNLAFALDPWEFSNGTSQITDNEFLIINKSLVDVMVAYYMDLEVAAGVTVVTGGQFSTSGINAFSTEKYIDFRVLGVDALNGTPPAIEFTTFGALATPSFITTSATNFRDFDGTTGASIGFILGAASPAAVDVITLTTTASALKPDFPGMTAFKFYADMTALGNWQPNDLAISGVLWLTGVNGTIVNAANVGNNTGHRMIPSTILPGRPTHFERPIGFYGIFAETLRQTRLRTVTITGMAPAPNDTVIVEFNAGNKFIRSMIFNPGAANLDFLDFDGSFTYSEANQTITFHNTRGWAIGPAFFDITLADNEEGVPVNPQVYQILLRVNP